MVLLAKVDTSSGSSGRPTMNNLRVILDIMVIVLLIANLVTDYLINKRTNDLIAIALQSNQSYIDEMIKLDKKYYQRKVTKRDE